MRVRRGLDGVQELHSADVIDVDLLFQHDDKSLPVQLDSEDGSREGEFAYRRLALRIGDDEAARRQDQGHQRGAEEHLDDGDIALLLLEDLAEGLAVVYPVAIVGADGQA